jgi:hypothetical protein
MLDPLADLHPTTVHHDDIPILYRACADEVPAMQAAWASFEAAVGLRGRRFYGIFDPVAHEYRVCVKTRDGDDPAALEAQEGSIPGGRYLRVFLTGEPPELYSLIGPTFQRMEAGADVDETRPFVEYYKRRDRIELLVPIKR